MEVDRPVEPIEAVEVSDETPDTAEFNKALGENIRPIGKWSIPETCKTAYHVAAWIHKHEDEFRARAAEIAVDIEAKGERWTLDRIRSAMGWDVEKNARYRPVWMREPDWSRSLEWERVKREANYRMSIADARPILRMTVSALLIETCRRALESPRAIKTGDLLDATRKYMELLGQMEGSHEKAKDVAQVVNIFMANVNLLPPSAQQKALGLFNNELRSIERMLRGHATAPALPAKTEVA